MKILLTGGSGFIGSHLLAELRQAGHDITAVCRNAPELACPMLPPSQWLNISLSDISPKDLNGIDAIIHLASAGVSPRQASWLELMQINVATGVHLLKLAAQAGVRRFVAAGTCLEYGVEAENWERVPTYAPLRPITPYGASKAAGYLMLHAFAASHHIEFFYGRIFSAYGEGQFSDNLWPSLRRAALTGLDFRMTTGEQVRDFIPVKKVAFHLRVAAERSDIQPGLPLVVNIGTGSGVCVIDFARREWKRLGATGRLIPGAIVNHAHQIGRLVAETTNLNAPNEQDH